MAVPTATQKTDMTKRSTQKKREARRIPFPRGNDRWKGKYKPQNHQYPVPSSQPTPLPSRDIQELPRFEYNLRGRDLKKNGNDFKGNRVISLVKMLEAINEIVQEHSKMRCTNSNIEYENELKLGLGCRLQFRCNTCGYKTTSMKMYDEIRNTKRASINTNLASALMDTPMGPSRAEEFFTQLDIPFLCTSHLQKLTRDVNTKIVAVNNRDMAEKRHITAQHNSKQTSDQMQIDISMDARYNRHRMTSSYKPGQSSSQAYAIATENHTDDNYIIGLATENKLCWTGAALHNKGSNITCPGHADCTANLSYFTPHSERRMAFNIAKDLHEDGFYVRTLTTDGDTKAYMGMKHFYSTTDNTWEVTRQSDPNHLAARQQRKVRNTTTRKHFVTGARPYDTFLIENV